MKFCLFINFFFFPKDFSLFVCLLRASLNLVLKYVLGHCDNKTINTNKINQSINHAFRKYAESQNALDSVDTCIKQHCDVIKT